MARAAEITYPSPAYVLYAAQTTATAPRITTRPVLSAAAVLSDCPAVATSDRSRHRSPRLSVTAVTVRRHCAASVRPPPPLPRGRLGAVALPAWDTPRTTVFYEEAVISPSVIYSRGESSHPGIGGEFPGTSCRPPPPHLIRFCISTVGRGGGGRTVCGCPGVRAGYAMRHSVPAAGWLV